MLAYRLRSQKEADILADYDVAVKSGKLEYEEVLLDFVLACLVVSEYIFMF